jgi:hypothetical protein
MSSVTQTILKLKVKISQIKRFPFDIIYIVNQTQKDLIPRMFPCSLCLPFNAALIARLKEIHVDQQIKIYPTYRETTLATNTRYGDAINELLEHTDLKTSFLVVPVLAVTRSDKKTKSRKPAYLVAKQHSNGERITKNKKVITIKSTPDIKEFLLFFNDFATMFTPQGPLRPICQACPNNLEHMMGRCTLGEYKCYENLIIQPAYQRPHELLQTNRANNDSSTP